MSKKVVTPQYWVYIRGQEIPSNVYPFINSIKIKKTFHGASQCTITIQDPDLIYLQDNLFIESTPIVVKYNINSSNKIYTFEGYVSVIDVDFPEQGTPSITINCMDKSHLMNRKEKTRTWSNKKASDVASEIFRSYGFKAVVDDSGVVLESIEQSNQTDITFLLDLANKIEGHSYLVYIEGETAYFVKKVLQGSPKHNLYYKESPYNLYSFKPRINKESKKILRMNYDIDIKTLKVKPSVITPVYSKLGANQVKVSGGNR